MIFETKFNIGDTVYIIEKAFVFNVCPLCGGVSKIDASIAGEQYEIRCPKCKGQGRIKTTDKPIWVVQETVSVSISSSTPQAVAEYIVDEQLITDSGIILKLKLKNSSGAISPYEVNKFKRTISEIYAFATREEAQQFCDLANIQEEL